MADDATSRAIASARSEARGESELYVVGIGASAGGLEAFTSLLSHLPSKPGLAFVLVQHLDPKRESMLSEILSRSTDMPIHEVRGGMRVEIDNAYVIPLVADIDRVTPDGKVRVYATRDAGGSWTAFGDGLPDHEAFLTIYRQAFGAQGEGADLQLYFGATSGDVFGSTDAGATWFSVHERLAPVTSVRVA